MGIEGVISGRRNVRCRWTVHLSYAHSNHRRLRAPLLARASLALRPARHGHSPRGDHAGRPRGGGGSRAGARGALRHRRGLGRALLLQRLRRARLRHRRPLPRAGCEGRRGWAARVLLARGGSRSRGRHRDRRSGRRVAPGRPRRGARRAPAHLSRRITEPRGAPDTALRSTRGHLPGAAGAAGHARMPVLLSLLQRPRSQPGLPRAPHRRSAPRRRGAGACLRVRRKPP